MVYLIKIGVSNKNEEQIYKTLSLSKAEIEEIKYKLPSFHD